MGLSKLVLFSIVFFLIFFRIRADAIAAEDVVEPGVPDSSLKIELEQLKSKILVLESSITDRARELKSKDGHIAEMEKIIQEKSESIASLQSEIESLQEKGSVDAEEILGKAHARAGELEKQVEKLKTEIQSQTGKRVALETRASEAEKKVEDLNIKLESLQKTNEEQKRRIKKTERALQVAEEDLMKAQLEATSKKRQLKEIHGAWLPPWIATHWDHCQYLTATHWNKHGKPAMDSVIQKASEISAQAQKQVEPHLETAKTKWVPALKEQWIRFITIIEPYVQLASTKAVEVYEVSVATVTPHAVRAKEFADPYFREAKKLSKPYIDQVATITKPHVGKVRVALKPYTKRVVYTYGKFLKSATTYHHQVQATVQENLKKHEITKALATKELVWFVASAILALPMFFLYRLFSSIFCKKSRKPARNTNANHASRRPKRRHADK